MNPESLMAADAVYFGLSALIALAALGKSVPVSRLSVVSAAALAGLHLAAWLGAR